MSSTLILTSKMLLSYMEKCERCRVSVCWMLIYFIYRLSECQQTRSRFRIHSCELWRPGCRSWNYAPFLRGTISQLYRIRWKDHSPLGSVFRIIRSRYPNLNPEAALRYAEKELNYTMRPEGHVPSMLVFGTLPTFPILNNNIPGHEERTKALRTARDEVTNVKVEKAVRQAINHNIPPAAHYKL